MFTSDAMALEALAGDDGATSTSTASSSDGLGTAIGDLDPDAPQFGGDAFSFTDGETQAAEDLLF